ncbi:MAG: glutamate synthase large subunit [Coriobacteriales bacterium]|nr:glutamate synthase large subunit [Coriobacteriales bacterium]
MEQQTLNQARGLYEPKFEHDACGIGMLVDIKGRPSHKLVNDAIEILEALTHRGGVGYEPLTGDGAGILLQIPDAFMRRIAATSGIELPAAGAGEYGVAMVFASPDAERCQKSIDGFCAIVAEEGLKVLGVRQVPVSVGNLGPTAKAVQPSILQVFTGSDEPLAADDFERRLYIITKRATQAIRKPEHGADPYFYLASNSCKTIVYKGMLLPSQLAEFYLDLKDSELKSAIALVHSRFSTNTFPSWERAHPMHHVIHNGEINTIRGNVNWVKAREAMLKSELFGDELQRVFPVINEDGSDSAMLDDFVNLLIHGGYKIHEAAMMAIPVPWEENLDLPDDVRAMFEYKSCLVEPWDGPASVAFTDGRYAGAILDRNGLRPSRYYVTSDDMLILASEVGVLPIDDARVIKKDRLRPGRMLLVDIEEGRIVEDAELKATAAAEHPYRQWLNDNLLQLAALKDGQGQGHTWRELIQSVREHSADKVWLAKQMETLLRLEDFMDAEAPGGSAKVQPPSFLQRQKVFGYSWEDLNLVLKPIAEKADDPIASMGYDAPLAVLSKRPQLLYNYFKQLFAQVTNPPIDAIREHLVTSSIVHFGSEGNILKPDSSACRMISHDTPILSRGELDKLRCADEPGLKAITLPILFDARRNGALKEAMDTLFAAADAALEQGYNILILSDKEIDAARAPIPALLAVSGLHQHMVRSGTRTQVSIVIETGEPREVHHHALLVGFGANAICPYLAYELIEDLSAAGLIELAAAKALENYRKALTNHIIKVMSKMGISTVRSYHGAQIFEALGLGGELVREYFTDTTSRIGGIELPDLEAETLRRHSEAFDVLLADDPIGPGGEYKWRADGEYHLLNPESIYYLQQAVRKGDYAMFKRFSASINDRSRELKNLRALFNIVTVEKPIPIDSVESAESIVKRFKTGAMSFGSISREAHECMAIAMNNLGAKSNTGEGGESPDRFVVGPDGLNRCSSIKQVASGRFGVTINYLTHATEIQIKMAQGAKPGEGGHLPGRKVYPWVATNRFSTPGVELISPPPHHDIYSIEDLAQLIHDLKNANRDARINVKLVSEAGVGTIAVGVAKGLADVITISGFDGGTGAASRTSIRHAGLPWELGVAETHQSLVQNKLRDRVSVETDGKLFCGRDIVIAALLGADEFTFATLPLVAMGCDMMRVCNIDTCPVGIATQNPDLRKKFAGKPEHIENMMLFIAQEVREWMARIGVTRFTDLIGHVELLQQITIPQDSKARAVDLSRLLFSPSVSESETARHYTHPQDHGLEKQFDLRTLVPLCKAALEKGERLNYHLNISNRNRTLGTVLSSEITRAWGAAGLPDDTIHLNLYGSGGQSFGAFLAPGVTLELAGDTNDYLGKGMSGGRIVIAPPAEASYEAGENIIVGNVAFYGATNGEAYLAGVAGERFCVRNSGVQAVVEGVGDHGCEYMTGGRVVILGSTGRNFAAGMSGGVAYVWDRDQDFAHNCNKGNVTLKKLAKADKAVVREMLEKHVAYTGSQRAQAILADFDTLIEQFTMLIPNDYQKIIDAMAEAARKKVPEADRPLWAFNSVILGKKVS